MVYYLIDIYIYILKFYIQIFTDLSSNITKCCPACFNRITRLLANMQSDIDMITAMSKELAESPRWTEEEMSLAKRGLK